MQAWNKREMKEGEERGVAGEHMVYGVLVSSPPSSPLFSLILLHTWHHYSLWNQHPTKILLSLISFPLTLSHIHMFSSLCLFSTLLRLRRHVLVIENQYIRQVWHTLLHKLSHHCLCVNTVEDCLSGCGMQALWKTWNHAHILINWPVKKKMWHALYAWQSENYQNLIFQ